MPQQPATLTPDTIAPPHRRKSARDDHLFVHELALNVIRQRLEHLVDVHRALGNINRLAVLIAVLRHQDQKGVRPHELAKAVGLTPEHVSKCLTRLSDALLVVNNVAKTESGIASWFTATDYARDWFRFENLGSTEQVLHALCQPRTILVPHSGISSATARPQELADLTGALSVFRRQAD